MKILITGINGFTGSHAARAALRRGYKVQGYVRQQSRLDRINDLDILLHKGDITDTEALAAAAKNVDIIIHTAACVELGIVDQDAMHRVNVEGTRAVLKTCESSNIDRLIYCSTVGIFGDTKGVIVDESYQRSQKSFSSSYDETKFRAQELVDQYIEKGLDIVSVLPSGIFGQDDPHFGPLVSRFSAGKLPFIVAGDRITGIVHVKDVAELLLLATEQGVGGEKYIASGGELRVREMFGILGQMAEIKPPKNIPEWMVRAGAWIVEPIAKVLKVNPPLSLERVHYLYDRCVRVNSNKAQKELDWRPMTPEQILETLL